MPAKRVPGQSIDQTLEQYNQLVSCNKRWRGEVGVM